MSRGQIKHVVLASPNHDERTKGMELRDLYNKEDAFDLSSEYRPLCESRADAKHGSGGFYGLMDQVVIPFGAPGRNRGFGVTGSVTVAPDSYGQQLPPYYTAGASARGMFDARTRDALSVGVGSGSFSRELQRAQLHGHLVGPDGGAQDHETVTELTYRFDFHNSALLVQPDFQYIIQPGGTGHFKKAPVFGAQFGIFS